jgi:cytochrome c peroxidase
MISINLSNPRLWVGSGTVLTAGLVVTWVLSPGLPVIIGPWALASTKAAGQEVFEHEWEANDPLAEGDGVGPVYNARSCVACHNQGGVGGGGDNSHNVRAFEVMPTAKSPDVKAGVVHNFATDPSYQENDATVRQLYPIIKGRTDPPVPGSCSGPVFIPDFDPVVFEEVNTTALFGAGWIDLISEKAIVNNRMRRLATSAAHELAADFSDVPVGRVRTLPDGRLGKFGWKAQAATLEDFVAAACSSELGLGTPHKEQARPMHRPDYPASAPDLSRKQFKNLVAFVATLPRPVEALPSEPAARSQAEDGKRLFNTVGCAACHTPDLGGVKGVYSDFLLYTLEDENGNPDGGRYGGPSRDFPLPPDHPKPTEWKTPPLWGVADSAPYFHDGKSPTLQDAITRHHGDAKTVTERYNKLSPAEQQAVVAFLKTLTAPPDAAPVKK